MTAEATAAARDLCGADPARASAYHELLLVIGQELRKQEQTSVEPGHLRAVLDDVARVLRALDARGHA